MAFFRNQFRIVRVASQGSACGGRETILFLREQIKMLIEFDVIIITRHPSSSSSSSFAGIAEHKVLQKDRGETQTDGKIPKAARPTKWKGPKVICFLGLAYLLLLHIPIRNQTVHGQLSGHFGRRFTIYCFTIQQHVDFLIILPYINRTIALLCYAEQ